MKVSSLTFLTVSVVFLSLFGVVITANAQKKEIGINTVVIDAGHGGRDAGAVGRIYKEKDINLDVALRLGKMIGQKYPDVKVVYTRKTDVLIPLNERGNIANKAGADLFISIHINSNKSSAPSGTSTYVMGVDKAGKNLDVAMKENDVISYRRRLFDQIPGIRARLAECVHYLFADPVRLLVAKLHVRGYGAETVCQSDQNPEPRRAPGRFFGAVVGGDAEHPGGVRVHFESRGGEVRRFGQRAQETYARCLFERIQRVQGAQRGTWHTDCFE